MYEVELKVRADHADVEEHLDSLGVSREDLVVQEDTYYNAPDRDFAATDEALRLRREKTPDSETTRAFVTYKGPLVDSESKTRSESETGIDDVQEMQSILEGLGYEPVATVTKERERYTYEGCTVTLDSVEGLGEFVEVELESDRQQFEAARERAITVLEELGVDHDEQIRTSYLELRLENDG